MRRSAAKRTVSIEIPACSGSDGPGEMTMPRRLGGRVVGERVEPRPVDGVVAHDADVGPGRLRAPAPG